MTKKEEKEIIAVAKYFGNELHKVVGETVIRAKKVGVSKEAVKDCLIKYAADFDDMFK